MFGTKKDGNNLHNEIDPLINRAGAAKKYPFQTRHRNNSGITRQEDSENLIDKQSESKNDTERSKDANSIEEILTQVVNEPTKPNQSLRQIVNEVNHGISEDASLKIDPPKNEEHKIEINLTKVAEKKEKKKKIHHEDLTEKEIDEICGDRNQRGRGTYTKTKTPGLDPRFQQQNQTMRCFVMYTDFYRCENILGKGELACQWFKDVFTSICPLDWIRRWDEAREEGRLGWTKARTQGKFPGDRYGV